MLENLDNVISMGPYRSKWNYSSPSPRPIEKCHFEQSIWVFDAHRRTHRRGVSRSRNRPAEKIFDVHTSIISSPRYPSDIYAEREEDGIRTHVLTIMKLTSTR